MKMAFIARIMIGKFEIHWIEFGIFGYDTQLYNFRGIILHGIKF